ncbi:hypothetical protein [Scytonema sp. PRP1]|uniref:hypothetical protein n=1 Tax=Scytonema sp. PRP1 TaxID=3120513 RepID=UPI00300D28EC
MSVIQFIKTKASNNIQVRSTKLKPKLVYYAQLDNTTISHIVNQALEQYIASRDKTTQSSNPLAHWKGYGQSEKSKEEFEKLTQYLEENKTVASREYEFTN